MFAESNTFPFYTQMIMVWVLTDLYFRNTIHYFCYFTIPEHMSSLPVFSGVRVTRSLNSFICMAFKSMFVLFLWSLCCLSFCDLRFWLPFGIFKLFLDIIFVIHWIMFVFKIYYFNYVVWVCLHNSRKNVAMNKRNIFCVNCFLYRIQLYKSDGLFAVVGQGEVRL